MTPRIERLIACIALWAMGFAMATYCREWQHWASGAVISVGLLLCVIGPHAAGRSALARANGGGGDA